MNTITVDGVTHRVDLVRGEFGVIATSACSLGFNNLEPDAEERVVTCLVCAVGKVSDSMGHAVSLYGADDKGSFVFTNRWGTWGTEEDS